MKKFIKIILLIVLVPAVNASEVNDNKINGYSSNIYSSLNNNEMIYSKSICGGSRSRINDALDNLERARASGTSTATLMSLMNDVWAAFNDYITCLRK